MQTAKIQGCKLQQIIDRTIETDEGKETTEKNNSHQEIYQSTTAFLDLL